MTENISSKISVVVPSYNGIQYIADCLNSLRDQLLKPDEVILVDDGSTDETASFVERSYPEALVVKLDSNRGFAAAVNEGIRRCTGTYVALLNNDARAAPEWLSELKRALDKDPSIGSCSSKMLFSDRPDTINSIGIGFTHAGTAFDVGYGQRDGERFERTRPIFGACAGAAMYRRKVFDDIGLFDEDLFMWYEDADLSFRAQLAGYRCLYVAAAVVYHVGGGTASPGDRMHIHYCSRNQILVAVKNLPDPLRFRYFIRLLSVALKHSLKALANGELAVLTGYLAAVRDMGRFARKHKLTRQFTRSSASEILDLLRLDAGANISTGTRLRGFAGVDDG